MLRKAKDTEAVMLSSWKEENTVVVDGYSCATEKEHQLASDGDEIPCLIKMTGEGFKRANTYSSLKKSHP